MSLTETNKIDMISFTSEGIVPAQVNLVITDHLEWEVEIPSHLLMLQEKINAYLAFIETGQLEKELPEAINRQVVIDIYFQYEPTSDAINFLNRVMDNLNSHGICLRYSQYEPDNL